MMDTITGIGRARMNDSKIHVCPMTIAEAKAYVNANHRHHIAPVGGLFAVGITDGVKIRGVAIVGRPVSRVLDAQDYIAEVTRCCTDGVKNGCSMLYAACWRAARDLMILPH